jgi:hypothetical protein
MTDGNMSVAVAVAIHLAPELSPDLALRTIHSCEAALGADRCRLVEEPPSDGAYYATVTSDGPDAEAAHIVIVHRAAMPPVAERELAFAPEDGPGDRWASVGVVIAALVTADAGREPRPAPAPPKPAPKRPRPVPRRLPTPVERHPLRIDLLARLSRETATDFPKELGADLRASLALGSSPFFIRVEGGYAGRIEQRPSLSFPFFGAGAGVRAGAPEARWAAELHLTAKAECWILSASEPGRTDSDAVWRFGGAAGLDGIWAPAARWQIVAGAGVQALAPRVTVDVSGATTDRVSPFGAEFVLGVRFVH